MTTSRRATLVAVVEMTDDANEDHWAQSSWHARLAAVEAAVAAGHREDDLTVTWADYRTALATAPDGHGFAAYVTTRRGAPRYGVPRPPDADELARWEG